MGKCLILFSTKVVMTPFLEGSKLGIFFPPIFFTPKFVHFFTPKFLLFFTPKFLLFYTKNSAFFTPKILLFFTPNFEIKKKIFWKKIGVKKFSKRRTVKIFFY